MLKHDGRRESLNAGEHDGSDLALQLDVEIALDKITLDHGKVATSLDDLVELLEEERIELQGAQELAALLGQMTTEREGRK